MAQTPTIKIFELKPLLMKNIFHIFNDRSSNVASG